MRARLILLPIWINPWNIYDFLNLNIYFFILSCLWNFKISVLLIIRQFLYSIFKNCMNKDVIKILSDVVWISLRINYLDGRIKKIELKSNMNFVLKILDVFGIVFKPLKIKFEFFFKCFVNFIFLNIFIYVFDTDFDFLLYIILSLTICYVAPF
jgi:hypothetical protein